MGVGARRVTAGKFEVELDLTDQVLAIQAPPDYTFNGSAEEPLTPTLGTIDPTAPVSASVLMQKAKIFDDGLYAAVELAAQEGAGRHTGKAGLLASLGRALARADRSAASEVQELLLGAARLGGVAITEVPDGLETRVRRAVEAFLRDELRSKPIGFYTWSGELASIFQQDRMLQGEIQDHAGMEILSDALRADPAARAAYERQLNLISRLTNPLANPDLRGLLEARDRGAADSPEKGIRFFPPSAAHETEIMKKLYGDRLIPEGFVLMDEMIRRIRSGELDLEPRPESGWYDYQTWALEPLVIPERMPEGARLELDEEYRKLLLELFHGLMTLTRETHVKQLGPAAFGSAAPGKRQRKVTIDIAPELAAEPLVTFYLRRAVGYRFVRAVLEDSFGPGVLERLHRLTPGGPAPAPLEEELTHMEELFQGAHVSVSRQLGMEPRDGPGSETSANAAAERFAAWARALQSDPDLSLDLRAMVPVFYDLGRHRTKVWVFLGWSRRPISVSFARPPKARVLNRLGWPAWNPPSISWRGLYARLPYPVTGELYVDRILDRNEFRKLCDARGTRSEILRQLDASP
jgi:hypothetical protein